MWPSNIASYAEVRGVPSTAEIAFGLGIFNTREREVTDIVRTMHVGVRLRRTDCRGTLTDEIRRFFIQPMILENGQLKSLNRIQTTSVVYCNKRKSLVVIKPTKVSRHFTPASIYWLIEHGGTHRTPFARIFSL